MEFDDMFDNFPSEPQCIAFYEEQRWGKDGKNRYCPHCGSVTTYKFKDGRLYKCADCRKQFTVRTGTIFEGSHMPLRQWFKAAYLMIYFKKGVSSVQVAERLKTTQKTAWFMLQRIRSGLESSDKTLLSGIVEVDESYFGNSRRGNKRGPGDKAAVFGAVERKGKVKLQHVKSTGARVLIPEIAKSIEAGSTVYSDQYGSYRALQYYGYKHDTVNHSAGEYARGVVHTNTIEGGVWSHFKKSIDAIYIHVSRKHLQKYCAEYEFRYNSREMTDGDRFKWWFKNSNGRLRYRELINKSGDLMISVNDMVTH